MAQRANTPERADNETTTVNWNPPLSRGGAAFPQHRRSEQTGEHATVAANSSAGGSESGPATRMTPKYGETAPPSELTRQWEATRAGSTNWSSASSAQTSASPSTSTDAAASTTSLPASAPAPPPTARWSSIPTDNASGPPSRTFPTSEAGVPREYSDGTDTSSQSKVVLPEETAAAVDEVVRESRERDASRVRTARIMAGIIDWLGSLAAVVLCVYAVLTAGGANPENGITKVVSSVAPPLATGFSNLFALPDPTLTLVANYGAAAIFWLLASTLAARLIRKLLT